MKCPYRIHKVTKKTKVVTAEDVQNTEDYTEDFLDCFEHDFLITAVRRMITETSRLCVLGQYQIYQF